MLPFGAVNDLVGYPQLVRVRSLMFEPIHESKIRAYLERGGGGWVAVMGRVSFCPFLEIIIDAGLPMGRLCICSITLPVAKEFFGSPEEESSPLSLIPKTAAKEFFRLPKEVSSTLSFLIHKTMSPGLIPAC